MSVRFASHAGSWYTGQGHALDSELTQWLEEAGKDNEELSFPIRGCKAIIAPHAGYAYSGPAAAWAYKCIDTVGIKRVFILGPSHHVYLNKCALSACSEYSTPLGNLPLDSETNRDLHETGVFQTMDEATDTDEHSIEMHLPYVRKAFEGLDIKIVPILVGAINHNQEKEYGKLLAPYFARPDTFTVVSSDFCHWGSRFSYTFYYPSPPDCDSEVPRKDSFIRLSSASQLSRDFAIHESISALDHQAMQILSIPPRLGKEAHDMFSTYLSVTKNTICGRHPIGVLLGAIGSLDGSGEASSEESKRQATIQWVRYEQSSQCRTPRDSSVSYASAYVVF